MEAAAAAHIPINTSPTAGVKIFTNILHHAGAKIFTGLFSSVSFKVFTGPFSSVSFKIFTGLFFVVRAKIGAKIGDSLFSSISVKIGVDIFVLVGDEIFSRSRPKERQISRFDYSGRRRTFKRSAGHVLRGAFRGPGPPSNRHYGPARNSGAGGR